MHPVPVLASAVVNALFAISVFAAAVLACLLAAARRRLHDTQPVQTMADFAEELLGRSARSRAQRAAWGARPGNPGA